MFSAQLDELEIEHLDDPIFERQGLLEMEPGLEEEHGQVGTDLMKQMQDHETRRLERRRHR